MKIIEQPSSTHAIKWRELYHHALNTEVFLDSNNLQNLMKVITCYPLDDSLVGLDVLDEIVAEVRDWSSQTTLEHSDLFAKAKSIDVADELTRSLLINTIPMAGSLGCWLQGMIAPGVFEEVNHLTIMKLIACDIGVERPETSRFDEFKILLRQNHLSDFAVLPNHIYALESINDRFFDVPAMFIALSRRSDQFSGELCGIDICMRAIGLLPCWQIMKEQSSSVIDFDRLDLSASLTVVSDCSLFDIVREIANSINRDHSDVWPALIRGFKWCFQALKQWNASIFNACRASSDPEELMIELVRRRAQESACYHHKYKLDGQALCEWFKLAQHEPEKLVKRLASTHVIKPGDPDKSILLTRLIDHAGPMFRVFDDDEINVIRNWIKHLGKLNDETDTDTTYQTTYLNKSFKNVIAGDMDLGFYPKNIREAYFTLQGRALEPRTRQFAIDYIENWLKQAERLLNDSPRMIPEEWQPNELRKWLLHHHDLNSQEFERTRDDTVPCRDSLITSTLQLAPLTLIDGAWLQGFSDIRIGSSQVGHFLFRTLWDELGNGSYELNHPKIYRDVLREMGHDLPPIASYEFAFDNRFFDTSFNLPVYWLSLGKFPLTYMGTILGMNLAMEFSGVGGSYRSAKRYLKHYGYSSRFVDIHNTIDNISSGHTGWAAHAIDRYMLQMKESLNEEELMQEWQRIRIGYKSLSITEIDFFPKRRKIDHSINNQISKSSALRNRFLHHPAIA